MRSITVILAGSRPVNVTHRRLRPGPKVSLHIRLYIVSIWSPSQITMIFTPSINFWCIFYDSCGSAFHSSSEIFPIESQIYRKIRWKLLKREKNESVNHSLSNFKSIDLSPLKMSWCAHLFPMVISSRPALLEWSRSNIVIDSPP